VGNDRKDLFGVIRAAIGSVDQASDAYLSA